MVNKFEEANQEKIDKIVAEEEKKEIKQKTNDEIKDEIWNRDVERLEEKLKNEGESEEEIERQTSLLKERIKRMRDVQDAFEKGGGQPEVQEAKLKVKDLEKAISDWEKNNPEETETIEYMKKEMELNQRVVNGENLMDVLDSMKAEKEEEPEDEIIDLIEIVRRPERKEEEIIELDSKEEKEFEKTVEEMPEKERKGLFQGAVDISYTLQGWKNTSLSRLFKKAVGEKRMKEKGSSIYESSLGKRFLNAYSESYKEKAELSKKNRERERVGILKGSGSLLGTAGSFIKLGRIVWDVGYANPLRHVMAASMFVAKNSEMLKEAQLKSDKVIEKTRIKDAEEAALEAWAIHEKAEAAKSEGKDISKEDLEKEYQKILTSDLGKRLKKRNKKDGFILSKIAQDFGGFLINSKIKGIDKKISKIEQNEKLSPNNKKERIERYLERQKKNLNDYDRMVSTVGTIDLLSYTGRMIERTGKAVSVAMIADTFYRLPKIFASFTGLLTEIDEKTVKVDARVETKASGKLSDIWGSKTAEKGDSPLLIARKAYIEHAKELGYKGDINDAGEVKKWAGKFSTRHIVGQYISENADDYKELIDKIGTPPENPIELDKWMSKVPGSTFNEVLNNKVPSLIHVGDTVSIDANGNINAYDPEGKLRIGNLPIETQGMITTEGFEKIMGVEEFSNLSTEQVERIDKLFSRHLGASFEGFQSFDAAERAEKIANLEEIINKLKKEPSSNFIKKQLQELNMIKEIWKKFGTEDIKLPEVELKPVAPEVSEIPQEPILDETGTETRGETPIGSEDNIKEINELFKKTRNGKNNRTGKSR